MFTSIHLLSHRDNRYNTTSTTMVKSKVEPWLKTSALDSGEGSLTSGPPPVNRSDKVEVFDESSFAVILVIPDSTIRFHHDFLILVINDVSKRKKINDDLFQQGDFLWYFHFGRGMDNLDS